MMMALSFSAHCQRGHELIEFTDRREFERHMTGTHKARKPWPGMAIEPSGFIRSPRPVAAPGWRNGKIEQPYEWKGAKATPGGLARVAERIAKGEYDYGHRGIETHTAEVA